MQPVGALGRGEGGGRPAGESVSSGGTRSSSSEVKPSSDPAGDQLAGAVTSGAWGMRSGAGRNAADRGRGRGRGEQRGRSRSQARSEARGVGAGTRRGAAAA